MKPISIKAIADKLDCLMDDWKYYLNKKTGEIAEIPLEYMGIAEESEEDDDFSAYQDWEQDSIRDAMAVLDNWSDYVELPDQEEVNEYSIMESFCYSLNDDKLRSRMCNAITGRGAFRRFKDGIVRYGIEGDWYAYKYEALCEIAKEWCEYNELLCE